MLQQTIAKLKNSAWRKYVSVGALSLYAVGLVMLSVAWASIGVIQRNYKLQKDIAVLEQQVAVSKQQADNQALLNKYYASDAYQELAAREHFNKALADEKLIIIPKKIALSKLPAINPQPATAATAIDQPSNLEAWLNFFLGHNIGNQ